MTNRLLVAAIALAVAGPAGAQVASGKAPGNYAKWAGAWKRPDNFYWSFDPSIKPPGRQPAPYKPDYMKLYDSAAARRAANDADGGGRRSNCEPGGMPEVMNMVYLMELLPQPNQLIVISEYQAFVRRVMIGGRHAEGPPTYAGDTIAHWEGDTLVSETTGLRSNLLFAGLRHPSLKVTERMRLLADDTFEDIMSVDSPLFEHPWTVTKHWVREAGDLNEYVCEENERNPIDDAGRTGFVKPSE